LRNSGDREVCLESGEFRKRSELTRLLPENLKRKFFFSGNPGFLSQRVPLKKIGEKLSSALERNLGLEWEIIFKILKQNRFIKNNGKEKGATRITHHSVLVRFRKPEWGEFVEIGEGNTDGSPHNISGLLARMDDIIRCNSDSSAGKIPPGLPLVLGPGEGGIIFHEVLGHSLESDHVLKGLSPFSPRDLEKKVVSGNITLSTDRRGDSFFQDTEFDDEGMERSRNVLLENGVLRHFISDLTTGKKLGIGDRGNARTEDFTRRPMPRMYSLFLENGESSRGEIMESVSEGIFAGEFGDGKVLFHNNRFYFNIPSAWMIRKGKIADPLGSIIVSGKINEVFNSVEMVGNDFSFDRGISYCFKEGQILNVRVGQPSVKIGKLNFSRGLNDL